MLAIAVKFTAGLAAAVPAAGGASCPAPGSPARVGAALAAVPVGASSIAAFGPHDPELSDQSSLLTTFSVPNLLGLVLGPAVARRSLVRAGTSLWSSW